MVTPLYHLFVESPNASSLFPAIREVTFPTLPPLDLIGGTKLPRTPRREKPYDFTPCPLLAKLFSLCGETEALGDPANPRLCLASISCDKETI